MVAAAPPTPTTHHAQPGAPEITNVGRLPSTGFSIKNDGGAWCERPRTWLLPDGATTFDFLPQEVLVLDGSGDRPPDIRRPGKEA